jgi:SAM-dependent methyltransferase
VRGQLGPLASLLYPELRFLELGAGDCALSCEVAQRVARVYAVDVSQHITEPGRALGNLRLIIANACELPLAPQSVDLVYSDQVIEHLHPEDAEGALRETHRVLAPGGRCVCVTPPRITGPHDISKYFSRVATGFHLKEYTGTELHRMFRKAGFSRIGFMIPNDNGSRLVSVATYRLVETGLSALPFGTRVLWSERGALSRFFPIRIVAEV